MKKIFKFLFGWIGPLFNTMGQLAEKVLPVVISVTNTVKSAVDNPTADILVALTKTKVDDFLLLKVRKVLPQVLASTSLAQKFMHLNDVSEILNALKQELNMVNDTDWQKFWVDFAGMLTYHLADGKLSVGEAISLAQYYYHNKPT